MRKYPSGWKPTGCSLKTFARLSEIRNSFADFCGERRRQWHTFTISSQIPEWPCCYVIFVCDELVYIGETENLSKRIQNHLYKLLKDFDFRDITIKAKLPRRYGDWRMTELRLIKRLQPPMNQRGIKSREEYTWS